MMHKWDIYVPLCVTTLVFGTNEKDRKWAGDGLVASISVLFVGLGIILCIIPMTTIAVASAQICGLIVGTSNSADNIFVVNLQSQRELSHLARPRGSTLSIAYKLTWV